MKHKHAETLKAWADGIKCEYWCPHYKEWSNIHKLSIFDDYDIVRIKPEPQKEEEPQYLYVYNHIAEGKTCMSPSLMQETYQWVYVGKVRVEK